MPIDIFTALSTRILALIDSQVSCGASSVSQPGATPVGSVFFSKLTRRLRGNKFSTPACSMKTSHSKLKHK
jgi:hypothetical protein